jgi:penicillin-binding protein 2
MCWIYKDYHVTHGMVDVVKAIEYSCNYFFFSVADRLGIEKLSRWAENFGLNSRTNIELPNEAKGQIGSPESLYDATRPIDQQRTGTAILVYRAIRDEIKKAVAASKKTITDEKVNEIVTEVFALIGEPRAKMLKEISSILNEKSGISKSKIETEVKFHVADYLNEITWTPTSTITTGIGQSITMLTPIAVARYISALVNGGFVYDAHVVSKVVDDSGAPVKEMVPTVFKNLNISPEYLDSVKHGMKDVVQGDDSSTARKHFQGFKYVDQMGGKTGTAQVSKINLENNSWFVSFAPFDKPEIAVVVYIPNGYSGGMSAHTTKQIIQYYLDNNSNRTVQTLPEENKPLT